MRSRPSISWRAAPASRWSRSTSVSRLPGLPLDAAFRLRQAARRSGVALLVLGARRVVGGAAALSVRTRRDRLAWAGPGPIPRRLAGMRTGLHVVRKQGAPWLGRDRAPVVDGVSRLACVRVEAFAAAALERCEPALREQPLAVVTGSAARHARRRGQRSGRGPRAYGPGLTDAEAVVRCPTLVRRPVSAEAEAAARHALLEACLSVSPRLEDAAPGLVHVDLAGLGGLFGDEAEIGRRLRRQARAVGLEARVGIAGSRAAAGVAARVGPPVHVLAPGTERVGAGGGAAEPSLEWPAGLAATFTRWGLATLGDLAALPRHGVGVAAGTRRPDRARSRHRRRSRSVPAVDAAAVLGGSAGARLGDRHGAGARPRCWSACSDGCARG